MWVTRTRGLYLAVVAKTVNDEYVCLYHVPGSKKARILTTSLFQ